MKRDDPDSHIHHVTVMCWTCSHLDHCKLVTFPEGYGQRDYECDLAVFRCRFCKAVGQLTVVRWEDASV
jgi:hypothetical protein